jgi:hypothetical protein
MKAHIGTAIFDKFVENTLEYRDETSTTLKQAMKDGAFNRWSVYLLICNSNQAKYGSLSNGLVTTSTPRHAQLQQLF